MFFYRELPPSNQPPNATSLRIWFDAKNIDGSNNSTLVDGQTTNLQNVANRGTAAGSWISNDSGVGGNYTPIYRSATPSIEIGALSGQNRSLGLLSFDQATSVPTFDFSGDTATGFMVFSFTGSITNEGLLFQSISSDVNWWNYFRTENSNTQVRLHTSNTSNLFNFTPSVGVRYCLTWQHAPGGTSLRIKSAALITATGSGLNTANIGVWSPVIGSRLANGTPQNALVESFGIWEGSTDLESIETWVANYYGALG